MYRREGLGAGAHDRGRRRPREERARQAGPAGRGIAEKARRARGAHRADHRDRDEHPGVHPDIEGFGGAGQGQRGARPGARGGDPRPGGMRSRSCAVDLRVITEDIVTQLDQRLKEMGYSSLERRKLEAAITETLQHLKIQLGGKVSLLEDAAGMEGASRGRQGQDRAEHDRDPEGSAGEARRARRHVRAVPLLRAVLPGRVPRPRGHHHPQERDRRAHQRQCRGYRGSAGSETRSWRARTSACARGSMSTAGPSRACG